MQLRAFLWLSSSDSIKSELLKNTLAVGDPQIARVMSLLCLFCVSSICATAAASSLSRSRSCACPSNAGLIALHYMWWRQGPVHSFRDKILLESAGTGIRANNKTLPPINNWHLTLAVQEATTTGVFFFYFRWEWLQRSPTYLNVRVWRAALPVNLTCCIKFAAATIERTGCTVDFRWVVKGVATASF